MALKTKNRKIVLDKYDRSKSYPLQEAVGVVKKITTTKFDAGFDIAVRLGVDPRKATEMVRGTVALPYGTGRDVKVLALVGSDKETEAKEAGADYVGLEEYLEKIKTGWVDFDVMITIPSVMVKLGPLGRVLGPRGLMPNPKSGTVTQDVARAIKEVKAGKIDFRVDKYGIVHASLGKVRFEDSALVENIEEMIAVLVKLKPSTAKGIYIQSVFVSSTMSPSVEVDLKSVKQ